MGFGEFLKHAGLMLLWWMSGAISVLIGLYFLLKLIESTLSGNTSWIFLLLGLVFLGLGGLAILYGTKAHDQ